jgi:hypothetical protein
MLPVGLWELALPHQCGFGFCFRCTFRQPTSLRAERPSASFFSTVTRAPSVGRFQEARLYLGLEGQRQWSDLAVARSTPVRLALFRVSHVNGPTSAGLAGRLPL